MELNDFVSFLSQISEEQRKAVLLHLTRKQLQFLIEIIYNIARGNIEVTTSEKSRLSKHKVNIRKLLKVDLSRGQRTKRLLQINAILPFFIGIYLKHESRNDFDSERKI